jgi:hypothetical protein
MKNLIIKIEVKKIVKTIPLMQKPSILLRMRVLQTKLNLLKLKN